MNNTEKEQIELALSLLSKERVNISGLGAPINILKRLLEDSEIEYNQSGLCNAKSVYNNIESKNEFNKIPIKQ